MRWLLVLALVGCSARSIALHRPTDKRADEAVTALWRDDIHRVARDGDWLLTRSYYLIGDVIAATTRGEALSHASIYDAAHDSVIEAVGEGVREVSLAELLERNHYVIVVRPTGMTATEQREALDRARAMIGRPFDIRGMLGFDDPEAFYCSELVYWASQTEARTGVRPRVIAPSDLMQFGEVIYWSGKRDDRQLLQIAGERSRDPQAIR
ncbi:MAG: hypothetical protein KF773_40625 [Deltaproteobacteria bacterium]|nr:hypothetical protein [Deltaproteobacteria bacterium]MCW5808073.1 hypothetical protein [Deltaproteobacteria bacterium]